MAAETLDDALAETAPERAVLVTVEFRIDPAWTHEQLLEHLLDTFRITYGQITRETCHG